MTRPALRRAGLEVWGLLIGWLREPLAVALFNAAHGSEQMVIGACPKLLRLAVKDLHHQRIKNADLLQCFHVAMDAGEGCVETVEEIVDVRFWDTAKIRVSHKVAFLVKVICGQGAPVFIALAWPVFVFIDSLRKWMQQNSGGVL